MVSREVMGFRKFLLMMGDIKACLLLEGDFSWIFYIYAGLVSRDNGCFCSRFSFQGNFYDEQLLKTKYLPPEQRAGIFTVQYNK